MDSKGVTFFELKTTGPNPFEDKIYYISLTKFDSTLKARKTFTTYINPETILSDESYEAMGVSEEDLLDCPSFDDIIPIILPFLKAERIGVYDIRSNNYDFLIESFFIRGIDLKLKKSDILSVKTIEEFIQGRSLESYYYKYWGRKVPSGDARTKTMGDVFKYQCEFLRLPYTDVRVHRNTKLLDNLVDRYVEVIDGQYIFKFGKYSGKNFSEAKVSYLQWILDSSFPVQLKEYVADYMTTAGIPFEYNTL